MFLMHQIFSHECEEEVQSLKGIFHNLAAQQLFFSVGYKALVNDFINWQ